MVVDLIYRTPRIIGSEEKIALDRYGDGTTTQMLVGGVTLNHLSWAGLLGLRVGIFGKQGEDEYGRFCALEWIVMALINTLRWTAHRLRSRTSL